MAKYKWVTQQDGRMRGAVNRVQLPIEEHTMWLLHLMNKDGEWGYVAQAYEKQHLIDYVYSDLSELELINLKPNPSCCYMLLNGTNYYLAFKQEGPLCGFMVPSNRYESRNYVDIDLSGKDFRVCADVAQALDHAPILAGE